jgi:putative tryptophan/tyrosine transport system substrate-binding protein
VEYLRKLVITRRGHNCLIAFLLFSALFVYSCSLAYASENSIIVIIKGRNIGPYKEVVESFKESVTSDKKDIKIAEFDFADGSTPQDLSRNVGEITPRLVFSLGTPATKVARQAFSDLGLNVVYAMVLNPKSSNINPPGVSMDIPFESRFKELKRILPQVKKIGVIYSSASISVFDEASRACSSLGLSLVSKQVDSQKDFSGALMDIFKEIDCFLMIPDPVIYLPKTTEYLLLEALKAEIPVIGLSSSYTEAGALVAFDCDYGDLGKQAAGLVLKMLAGDAVGNEVVTPRKMKFSLNLKVADRLGINIPQGIINEAAGVFGR